MKNDNELLAAMPVRKAFFRLALPAVAAQLINILYNLVDKMFIGHIPGVGKQALAGVGVTAPVILAISAFAALVSMGGARSHIAFFNTLITDSFNIEYPFLVKINNKKQTNYSVFIENAQGNSGI